MPRFFVDQGHFETKHSDGKRYGFFRTMVAPLSDAKWKTVLNHNGLPQEGYYDVNGVRVAIGKHAIPLRNSPMPTGAKRYVPENYLPALGRALVDTFADTHPRNGAVMDISIGVTYTPNDYMFAPQIKSMLQGITLNVTSHYGVMGFCIDQSQEIAETRGGYWEAKLRKDLSERERAQMTDHVCVVVDIGGGTVDVVIVDSDGNILYTQTQTIKTGVNDVMDELSTMLKTDFKAEFMNGDPDMNKLIMAIETRGKYAYGKSPLDCSRQVQSAVNTLLADVFAILDELAPGAYFDTIILTGGGGEMFRKYIVERYSKLYVIRASSVAENMRYANLDGMRKYLKVLTKTGMINGF